jgi:hypothetical protein
MKNLLLAIALAASTPALAAEPLGMVIDVQGNATLNDGGKTARLDMLAYLNAQNEIQLSQGASMTATWYAGSKELKFSGPARLKVEPAGIKVVQGGAAQERKLSDEKIDATRKPPTRLARRGRHARHEADDARAGDAARKAAPGRQRALRRLGGLRHGPRADRPDERS